MSEYADPYDASRAKPISDKAALPFVTFMGGGKYPLEQRIEDKKRGIGQQKYPFVGKSRRLHNVYFLQCSSCLVWALTAAMIGVFINELVVNFRAQGSPISLKASICCISIGPL